MKWILLALVSVAVVSTGSAQSIFCFGDDSTDTYSVRVFLDNAGGHEFPNLNNCGTSHRPNKTDDDVRTIILMGNSPIIPNVVCRSFPLAIELIGTGIGLTGFQFLSLCSNLEVLDLSKNAILEIEANQFQSNSKLTSINLSANSIEKAHQNSLNNLGNLQVLDLSGNVNIRIDENFFQYVPNLIDLNLQACNLGSVEPKWLSDVSSLLVLNLSDNPLGTINGGIFNNLQNLQDMSLNNCTLVNLAASQFNYNSNLQNLYMSRNEFANFPSSLFRNQTSLQLLDLSFNPLTKDLPNDIFSTLTNLEHLIINNGKIEELKPEWFAAMANLKTLNLAHNKIPKIPYKTFSVENSLQFLFLQDNLLQALDATSFASLANLEILNVENNEINAIDSHFIEQPRQLVTASFLKNECIDTNIDDFFENREDNLQMFKGCFKNFDEISVETVTNPTEPYRWFSMRQNSLVVNVQAYSNVSIIFSDTPAEQEPFLKIQLGMNRNLYTFIYENDVRVWDQEIDGILHRDEWRSFVISWEANVFQFFQKGWQLPTGIHIIKEPFNINFFGIRADTDASFNINRVAENFKHDVFPSVPDPPAT